MRGRRSSLVPSCSRVERINLFNPALKRLSSMRQIFTIVSMCIMKFTAVLPLLKILPPTWSCGTSRFLQERKCLFTIVVPRQISTGMRAMAMVSRTPNTHALFAHTQRQIMQLVSSLLRHLCLLRVLWQKRQWSAGNSLAWLDR